MIKQMLQVKFLVEVKVKVEVEVGVEVGVKVKVEVELVEVEVNVEVKSFVVSPLQFSNLSEIILFLPLFLKVFESDIFLYILFSLTLSSTSSLTLYFNIVD